MRVVLLHYIWALKKRHFTFPHSGSHFSDSRLSPGSGYRGRGVGLLTSRDLDTAQIFENFTSERADSLGLSAVIVIVSSQTSTAEALLWERLLNYLASIELRVPFYLVPDTPEVLALLHKVVPSDPRLRWLVQPRIQLHCKSWPLSSKLSNCHGLPTTL